MHRLPHSWLAPQLRPLCVPIIHNSDSSSEHPSITTVGCSFSLDRATNKEGDRTRVIVYLRRVMGLENTTYQSVLPQIPWRPVADSDSASAENECSSIFSIDHLLDEEESDRGSGEFEWEGPPGDPLFPDIYPHLPQGRYLHFKEGVANVNVFCSCRNAPAGTEEAHRGDVMMRDF